MERFVILRPVFWPKDLSLEVLNPRSFAALRMTNKGSTGPFLTLVCHSEGEARSRSIPGGEESVLEAAQNQRQVPRPLRGCCAIAALSLRSLGTTTHCICAGRRVVIPRPAPWPVASPKGRDLALEIHKKQPRDPSGGETALRMTEPILPASLRMLSDRGR